MFGSFLSDWKLEEKLMRDVVALEAIATMKAEVLETVESAFNFAESAEFPDVSEAYEGVFKWALTTGLSSLSVKEYQERSMTLWLTTGKLFRSV